jgi:predicted transcriptional regulator of viral defense system
MLPREEIDSLFKSHNGIMSTAELQKAKLYYADIQKLLRKGKIEKLRRGYYQLVDSGNLSEAALINRLFPDAVICLDSALFYLGYSDRTPGEWHLAVDRDARKSRFKLDYPFVKPHYFESTYLPVGETTGEIDGVTVRIYDKDRTICDCLRQANKMDKEIFNKAIQAYINDPKKNVPNLMRYAKILHVEQKVHAWIGVWL